MPFDDSSTDPSRMEVVLCRKDLYMYFVEYINSVLGDKKLILYDDTSRFTENWTYWCLRKVPFHILPKHAIIKFINTEQLTVADKLKEYNLFAKDGIEVYDYSLENIKLSGKGIYLPYRENPDETTKLRSFMNQKKLYDFAVIGTQSIHRDTAIQSIKSKGYTVHHIHKWGDTRDEEVGKCKYLLNLHYNENYVIYESIRCDRWRFAGLPVYSEKCLGNVPAGVKSIPDILNFSLDV